MTLQNKCKTRHKKCFLASTVRSNRDHCAIEITENEETPRKQTHCNQPQNYFPDNPPPCYEDAVLNAARAPHQHNVDARDQGASSGQKNTDMSYMMAEMGILP